MHDPTVASIGLLTNIYTQVVNKRSVTVISRFIGYRRDVCNRGATSEVRSSAGWLHSWQRGSMSPWQCAMRIPV